MAPVSTDYTLLVRRTKFRLLQPHHQMLVKLSSMLPVRLKWLIFITIASGAVIMTLVVLALILTTLLENSNQLTSTINEHRNSFAFVWLPQRSLLPRICISQNDCGLLIASSDLRPNVAVLIVATGRYYKHYVKSLLISARKFFCKSCSVQYFIFTDSTETETFLPKRLWPEVEHLKQQQLGWPFDSMARFSIYRRFYNDYFKHFDYIISMDADLMFVNHVERELLGDLVGVLHPGFFGLRGTYEEGHADSTAYVRPFEGTHYFTGGLWAASSRNFGKLVNRLSFAVDEDLKRGIIAIWHDESHLNRYFIDHQPTTILSPIYHFPSNRRPIVTMGDDLKIVTLNKTYSEVRHYETNDSSTSKP